MPKYQSNSKGKKKKNLIYEFGMFNNSIHDVKIKLFFLDPSRWK